MAGKSRPYVGRINQTAIVFRAEHNPTKESHPMYDSVTGPFKTMRGAIWHSNYGFNNPHVQTVTDSEKFAKEENAS